MNEVKMNPQHIHTEDISVTLLRQDHMLLESDVIDVVITLSHKDHMLYHYHQDTKQLVLSEYIDDIGHYNYGVIDGTCDALGYPLSVGLVYVPYAIAPGAHVKCIMLGYKVDVNGRKVYDVIPVQESIPLTCSRSELLASCKEEYGESKLRSIQEYREAKTRYMNMCKEPPIQHNKITNYFMPM